RVGDGRGGHRPLLEQQPSHGLPGPPVGMLRLRRDHLVSSVLRSADVFHNTSVTYLEERGKVSPGSGDRAHAADHQMTGRTIAVVSNSLSRTASLIRRSTG